MCSSHTLSPRFRCAGMLWDSRVGLLMRQEDDTPQPFSSRASSVIDVEQALEFQAPLSVVYFGSKGIASEAYVLGPPSPRPKRLRLWFRRHDAKQTTTYVQLSKWHSSLGSNRIRENGSRDPRQNRKSCPPAQNADFCSPDGSVARRRSRSRIHSLGIGNLENLRNQ